MFEFRKKVKLNYSLVNAYSGLFNLICNSFSVRLGTSETDPIDIERETRSMDLSHTVAMHDGCKDRLARISLQRSQSRYHTRNHKDIKLESFFKASVFI